jgi:ATP-dependent helicase Lhr and Lhr-like helicase
VTTTDDPDEPIRLRRLLPRTHMAFLARFARPTEVQSQAIPEILEGRDTLLCAPTASGKTEAYAAPAVERLLGSARRPLSLLVVSPTRALANDLHRRLVAPMDSAGVVFGRYTGEHKDRSGGSLPEAVVATPEALDSLLDRRAEILRDVHTIVLDEIHILDGTPRGDQLRLLLERLEEVTEGSPQRIAASATVGDPAGLAGRYLKDAAVIDVVGARAIRATPFPGLGPEAIAEHLSKLARAGARKILVFCNRRRDVDRLAAEMVGCTPFAERIFAHHGSLSRGAREGTERRFLDAPAAVAFATLTLELGIDIGTVDYVLLVEPPPSVSNLLQRIGRGGRRGEVTRVGYAFGDPGQELQFRALLRAGKRRDLCEAPYVFRPGVPVQQALVLAGSRGHVTASPLQRAVPADVQAELPRGFAGDILDAMVDAELLERPRGGRYVLAGKEDQLYDLGKLHSNFSTPPALSVIDRLTGDVLGEFSPWQLSGASTQLGGKSWRPVKEIEGGLLADRSTGGEAATYSSSTSPSTSLPLARAVAAELGASPKEWLQRPVGNRWVLLHGLGTLGGVILAAVLEEEVGAKVVAKPGPFTLGLRRPLEELPLLSPDFLRSFVRRHHARLARACGMGPYHHVLPEEIGIAAVHRALDPDRLCELFASIELRTLEVEERRGGAWEWL